MQDATDFAMRMLKHHQACRSIPISKLGGGHREWLQKKQKMASFLL
jgi:hypothetical protein